MLLIAFRIKAAVFPLSAWLPDSYPTAPAPVTAVFAGLLTKVGVYAIIRTQTLLFPDGALNDAADVGGAATMIIGILGAVAQSDIKRMLSFTLVSHIGYMVFGIALGDAGGHRRRDLLRRAPHPDPDDAVPRRRASSSGSGGSDLDRAARRPGAPRPCSRSLFFVPAMNLGRHPAVLGLHRQGRAARGGRARAVVRWPGRSSPAAS